MSLVLIINNVPEAKFGEDGFGFGQQLAVQIRGFAMTYCTILSTINKSEWDDAKKEARALWVKTELKEWLLNDIDYLVDDIYNKSGIDKQLMC